MQGLREAEAVGKASDGPLLLVVFDDQTWRWYTCIEWSSAADGVRVSVCVARVCTAYAIPRAHAIVGSNPGAAHNR